MRGRRFAQAFVDGGADAGVGRRDRRRARRARGRRPRAATRRGAGRRRRRRDRGRARRRPAGGAELRHPLGGRRGRRAPARPPPRGVVRLQHARRPLGPRRRRTTATRGRTAASTVTAPWRSSARRIGGAVDDGGLDPDGARPTVEHEVDVGAEVGPRRGPPSSGSPCRSGWPTVPRGRRRTRASRRERQRVGRHPQPDRGPPAGHDVGHARRRRSTSSVSGPGQWPSASAARGAGTSAAQVQRRSRRPGAR